MRRGWLEDAQLCEPVDVLDIHTGTCGNLSASIGAEGVKQHGWTHEATLACN